MAGSRSPFKNPLLKGFDERFPDGSSNAFSDGFSDGFPDGVPDGTCGNHIATRRVVVVLYVMCLC